MLDPNICISITTKYKSKERIEKDFRGNTRKFTFDLPVFYINLYNANWLVKNSEPVWKFSHNITQTEDYEEAYALANQIAEKYNCKFDSAVRNNSPRTGYPEKQYPIVLGIINLLPEVGVGEAGKPLQVDYSLSKPSQKTK